MSDWPVQFTSDISWLSLALLFLVILLLFAYSRVKRENSGVVRRLANLENQIKMMSSGHLGMGREIKRVVKEIANVEELKVVEASPGASEKTYEQAALLLSRGATIEEVVAACEITPSEAELIAIMSHSAPAHSRNTSNNFAA